MFFFFVFTPHLLHREGSDDIFGQELGLYQRHLHISVYLRVIRPVFTAFYLKRENTLEIKSMIEISLST